MFLCLWYQHSQEAHVQVFAFARLFAAGFGVAGELLPSSPSQLPAAQTPRHPAPHGPHRTGFEFPSLLQVHELNGIKIVTYCSPLYFANSEIFREKIIAKVSNALKDFCLQPIPNSPCSLLPCQAEIIKPRIIMKDHHIHALFFRSLLSDFLILDLILEAVPESWQVSFSELCQSRVSLLHVSSPCTCWHPVPRGLWLCGRHHDHLVPV